MWEAFLDLFRTKPAPAPEPPKTETLEEANKRADYEVKNISTSSGFRFRGEVFHTPTRRYIGTVYADSEEGLVARARTRVDDDILVESLKNKTINL